MIDLILEFASWPIRADPEAGMEIFLADTENAETLPRQKVLEFLQRQDERLAVRYLEHVIMELGDLSPDLHMRLLVLYLERLKRRNDEKGGFEKEEEEVEWKGKFEGLLRGSEQYSASRMLERLPRDGMLCCFLLLLLLGYWVVGLGRPLDGGKCVDELSWTNDGYSRSRVLRSESYRVQ